jgi:hypothetical protein
MNRFFGTALLFCFAASLGAAGTASAKPCRDAHGRFMKCHTMMSHKMCRDKHGKFMKCR